MKTKRRRLQMNVSFPVCLLCLILAGCGRSKETTPATGTSAGATAPGQYHEELLTYAIDNLNRLEEFQSTDALQQILQTLNSQDQGKTGPAGRRDPLLAAWPEPEMLRQIVDRLNQWIRAQPTSTPWKPDPMVASLSVSLAKLPQVKDLDRPEFSRFDGYFLQEAVWLRDIGLWARGDALDDLDRAASLFDWTVRNIQIEADAPQRIPQFPWETLFFGRGTAIERAWVFILLARQQGIDAAMLGIETRREAKSRGLGTSVPSGLASDNPLGSRVQDSEQPASAEAANPQSPIPNPSLRPWCVAVLIEGNAYLFDPLLGLPIPGPDGVSRNEAGDLTIRPATLTQAVADEKLLRCLDANDDHKYGVKASDLKRVLVLLEASPAYLAERMKLLESRLTGPQKMVLSTSPSNVAELWRTVAHVADVRIWPWPYETLERRSHLDHKEVQARLALLLPFYAMPSAPLERGRVLHLKGRFVGDDGAIHYYQAARPSNQELSASSSHPMEKLLYLRGKQDASYWSGLIAYQRANYPTAVDYFATRTLLFMPNGPWTDGARYNLARTFEATGDAERAILQYQGNANSPGYLGDLLRAKWLKKEERREGK